MRNIKKILLVLLMITTFFGITNVKALGKDIQVTDISVKEKSGTITVVDPVVTDNEVTSNITFNQKDDFVTFELIIKNNESKKYKIESITDNNTNENLKIDYSFSKDYISTGGISKATIKLTYKNQLKNIDKVSLNDLTIKISLVNEDGDSEEIIINPTTGDNIFHYLLLLIVALVGIGLLVAKKKIKGIKIGSLFVVLAVVLLPLAVFANEKYEISLKFTNVDIIGEFDTYSITIDPNNGDAPTVKDITYGQKIGDLPANPTKDGYTFNKWVDEAGNEVTKDTVITGPIEVIATYNLVTYNISYDLDDGSLPSGKSNPTEYTIESQSITLNNPEKRGYTFAGWSGTGIDGQSTEVTIEHGSKGDRTYTANYLAKDDTKYTVIHKFQKLTEGYDEETVEEHGTTGSTVPAPRKTRTGFVTPAVQNVTIEADESASVTYVYDRETYAFSITDRTYVDSTSTADGTYKYGTEITVKAQERPGYGFAWSDGNTNYERTFELSEETNLTPEYTADTNTPYVVKHYKMDLDGEHYTIADVQNLSGTTDSPISPEVNTYEGFTSPQVQSTTIGGDGHTVVKYYYTRNQVTVTFTNTEYIEEEVTTGPRYYGEQITITAKDRDGYTFTGWTNGETSNPLTITVGTSNVSVGPEYTAKTNTPYVVNHYKMNLDGENYTKVEDDTQNLTGTTDATITPAVNTYDGFTSPSTQTTTISGKGDTVVNYYYTRNKYTLTINHPEYLEEDKSGEYYYEEEITLTAIDRQGYTFAGWNTGETTKTITVSMPVDGITEEATYTSNTDTTYSVTHKYKKLTEGYDEVTISGTGTTGETIPAPLRPQTGFVNPTVQNITIAADGQASVTYIYDRAEYAFSITDRTYLDSTSTANGTYPYGTEITLKAQERTGYTFKWSDDITDLERTFELTEATTLSLVYTADTYTLTADANEGTIEETTGWTGTGATATKTITYDSAYGTLPTVKRTGYTFTGWTSIISGIEVNIDSSTTVFTTTDQTITANWSIDSYTVSFDVDGGSSVPSQTINYGGKVTKPANPTKENFAFAGWYEDDTLTTPFDFENTTIDKTTTIYAKWSSCNGFATASWNTIVSNLESDSSYYPVGCQRRVGYNNGYYDASYKVRLANTSTPEICNTPGYSQTACGTVIEFVDVIEARQINSNGKNTGGWKESNAASFLNGTFYDRLESNVKSVIIPTYPIVSGSGNDNNSANITNEDINLNKIYYLSAKEVGFDLAKDNKKNDTRTLDYYDENNNNDSRRKTTVNNIATDWWLRTASSTSDSGYFRVESEGTTDSYNAAGTGGNTPAFRIGRMPEFTVTFNTDEGTEIASQTVSYGSTATRPGTNPTKTGFIFDDWYTDDTLTTKYDFTTPITGDTTIYARYNDGCYNFRTDSWSTISSNIETDPSYYPLGCTKEVEMDMNDDFTPESYTVRLSNTSTPEECNTLGYSQTSCGTVVEFIDIPVSKRMNSDNDNDGGWKETELVTYLNSDFYNKLPSDLKSAIIPTYPIVSGSGSSGVSDNIINTDTTKNKLYLLSGKEVGYILTHDNKKEETRLLDYYYANYGNASRIKTNISGEADEWWLRTAFGDSTAGFYTVGDSGTSGVEAASYSYGVAPAFRIGKNTYTVNYNANGGTVTNPTKEVIKGEEIGTLPTPTPGAGKIFDKWYTGIDSGVEVTSTYQVNNNITIYARYTNQEFTVTFDTDGGSEVSSQTVSYGSNATRPATDPTKTNYTFDDWYTTDQYTTKYDFTTPITGDTTIYAHFVDSCNGFSTDSWSTIRDNLEANPNYYAVGCTKEVEMDMNDDSTPESYTVRLANTSTPEVCNTDGYSQTACGTVIEFVDIAGTYVWNVTNTAAGGWKNSAIASYLNSDFYNKLPSDLKAVMKPTYPIVSGSCNDNNSPDITVEDTNLNKLYLLSAREVGYDLSTDNKRNVLTDTRTLDYYEINSGDKDKQKQLDGTNETWWLRTPTKDALAICYGVYSSGTSVQDYCRKEHGIAPAFRIGTVAPSKYTVSFDTDGGSEVPSQTINSGSTATRPTTDPEKTGYVFDDWYTTDQYTTKYDFTTPITGDTTIYAKFDELKTCAENENITRLSENTCSNNENITVGDGIVCKRAVKLHEETCSQTDETYYCSGAGYTESGSKGTSTITYGSCGTSGTLTSGDAFTCDVNGDEDFDELTERFYYVSDYYDTSAKEFDDSTAVLIYYNNVTSGLSCNRNTFAYDSNNQNWYGPRTLISQLPTTSQWSNVSLKSDTRAILAENQSTHDSPETVGGTLPTDFSYEGYAARLLTAKELMSGCNLTEVGRKTTGELDSCNYIMENTRYAKSTIGNIGTWLETPYAFDSDTVWYVGGYYSSVRSSSTNNTNFGGARPAIEVPKTAIDIGTQSKYTVSFDSDGGSTVSDIEVDAGDSINELPTPTKTDSIFVGWFESVTDENPVTTPYTPSGDITLIAKWNNIICKKATTLHTETCNQTDGSKYCSGDGYANGDTITYGNIVSSDTYEAGDAFDCDVDGTGYNQRFYYLRTNDNKAVLISNKNYTAASKQADQNISFIYSQAHDQLPTTSDWGNLPVKFDGKPARLITMEDLLTVTNSSSPSDITPNGSLKGYEFLFESSNFSGIGERSTQWLEEVSSTERYRYRNDQYNLAQVESGKENTSKNPVRPVIEVPTDLIEDAYIVKFNANGGDSSTEYVKVVKGSSVGTLPTATRSGYIFDGWYTSLDYTIPVTENTVPNGYVTYYAKWTGDISDASFAYSSFILSIGDEDDIVINNSSDYESVTYTSNDTSIVTVNNSGHLTAVDDGETTITVTGSKSGHTRTINVKVTEEITDFVVHFDSMGGSSVNDMNVPKNTAIGSLPEDPILAENIFAGWYTNTNYSTKVTTDTVIRSDVTFYAKWIPENAVAEINHSYFTSLQSAFDSEMTGKTTITLLKDISVENTYLNLYTKNLGKDIVLDLNNKTITGSGSQTIRTKTSLEIKNGTITQSSSNGTIDVGSGGHLIMNNVRVENSGERAAIYNEGGTVELGGTVYATSNAVWASNNQRGTVQNKSGTTIITGGTYINTRSSNSYAVSATAGTLTIGTKDDIYNTSNIVIQGETSGIYSAVNYSIYDGMIKGINSAVNDESKITSIEDNATKVNDVDGSYNILYYTVPNNKYRIDLDAGEGTVNPSYILIDAGDQIGTLPTPTRGVYTFDGWFDSNDVEADPTHQPTSSETYYAKWHYEASNNVVNFNMNNGAIDNYANSIGVWKNETQADFQADMMANLTANSCSQCENGTDSNSCNTPTQGNYCDQSLGYSTGLTETLNVYESDEISKAKGNQVTYTTSTNGTIYNMIPGEVYYWESVSDPTKYGLVKATGYRRMITTSVRNVRDLGGFEVDVDDDGVIDGTVEYGKLFRGAQLSSSQADVTNLQKLGITREIDLRPDSEGKNKGQAYLPKYDIDTPGEEEDVIMHNYLIDYSTHSTYYTELRNTIKTVMKYVVEDNDSIYFHCTIGTDRTGTLAYFLEGLLGVSEEDRVEDYELSYYFGLINRDRYHDTLKNSSIIPRFASMHNTYNTNAKIYDWFMNEDPNLSQAEKDADELLLTQFRSAMIKPN